MGIKSYTDADSIAVAQVLAWGSLWTAAITMTMTHSEKSVQQPSEAWPYRHERRRHDTTKKKSVTSDVACSVGKVCTTADDSVQYIEHKRNTKGLIMVTLIVSFMKAWCAHFFDTRHLQLFGLRVLFSFDLLAWPPWQRGFARWKPT